MDASGNLYVSDTDNARVLEYNTPLTVTAIPGSGDTTADLVFGQLDFFSSQPNQAGGLSASTLVFPKGMVTDPSGNLYIADTGNDRVLKYDQPLATPTATATATATASATLTATPTPTATATTTLTAAPKKLNFSKLDASGTRKPKKVELTNKGMTAAVIGSVTATAPFEIAGGTNTCSGQTIASKKKCSFDVEFAPLMVANVTNGSIVVPYNGANPAVVLEGDGVAVEARGAEGGIVCPRRSGRGQQEAQDHCDLEFKQGHGDA